MNKPALALCLAIAIPLFGAQTACSTGRGAEIPAVSSGLPDPPQAAPLRRLPPPGYIPLASVATESASWNGADSATYCLTLLPGGAGFVASGEYAEILVFTAEGRLQRRLPVQGHAPVWGLASSGDGKFLALASPAAPSRVIDSLAGTEVRTGLPPAGCCSIAFVPGARAGSERLALGGTTGMVGIVEVPTWDRGYEWEAYASGGLGRYLVAAAFSPDGRLLATGGLDYTLSVWHANDGSLVGRWPPDTAARRDINGLAWSPDASCLAVTGQDGGLRVYNINSGLEVWSVAFEGWLRAVAWSQDGRYVAAGGEAGRVVVFSATDGRPLLELAPRSSPVWALAFSRDSSVLASGAGRYEAGGGDTAIVFTTLGDLE